MNKVSSNDRGPCIVEGVSKTSLFKQAFDLNGRFVKVHIEKLICIRINNPPHFVVVEFGIPFVSLMYPRQVHVLCIMQVANCHDSAIYFLAALRYATVYGCSDSTIVLGAAGKAVRVKHCERVHVIAATKRICIANCRECVFFLGVNQRPLIVGDNHKLHVNRLSKIEAAPYNTFYSHLEEHMTEVSIEPTINKWNEYLALGEVDPQDSLSHPTGATEQKLATRNVTWQLKALWCVCYFCLRRRHSCWLWNMDLVIFRSQRNITIPKGSAYTGVDF